MDDKLLTQIQDSIKFLNARTKEYDEGHPTISDQEWDSKYFELVKLEKESGIVLDNSPTQSVVFEIVNALKKIEHNHKMLSLEKTKDIGEIATFIDSREYVAMAKMDGLTCSLRYSNGRLVAAETRGNGVVGEDILHNARVIPSIPKVIPYIQDLTVDGEIVCKLSDFINFSNEYKNPRNFASGSIRLLDSKECSKRNLTFVGWDIINDVNGYSLFTEKLNYLDELGFTVVPFTTGSFKKCIDELTGLAKLYGYPIDGLVFKFNDIKYGKSLGETSHHFKNAMAYKFYDEEYPSKMKSIEWTMGRTGILTPVAVFEPIEMDGSTVERASLHNISIMTELMGGSYVGQDIKVFKANMIIPQISWARGEVVGENPELIPIPKVCPVCGQETQIVESDSGTQVLYCSNPTCAGKLINRLDHFCGKKGLDIKGLSKATFEKLIDWSWITNLIDIFELSSHREEWIKKDGFGIKSVDNILNSIETAKHTTDDKFIAALGIPLVGSTLSKELCKKEVSYFHIREDIEGRYDFMQWDGIGWEISQSLLNFDYSEADEIWFKYLKDTLTNPLWVNPEGAKTSKSLDGEVIVITGKLSHYKNRAELQTAIEANGGKVVGAISSKTTYLINNDTTSTSAKNVSAKKLGVSIISEEDFIKAFGI